jgi:NADH-quinone oxidoreductase subunit F
MLTAAEPPREVHIAAGSGPLLLAHPAASLADYRAHGGYAALERARAAGHPEQVLVAIEAAGLRGRGGAAFPTARKWRAALEQPAPRFLICNGGEDEPGSLKDRLLMEQHAHTLLEGFLIAAWALGVERGFLYVNASFAASLTSLRRALSEARQAGLLDGLDVTVVEAPDTYVAGEESAALEVIEGRRPLPRRKPPYPTESGLWKRATIINNVETLAAVCAIIRHGPDAYRRFGTSESPGTVLLTVSGWIEAPGVYEVPFGTPLRTIIETYGGGLRLGKSLKAISPGGASTAYLPASKADVCLDYAALQAAGSALGCGTLRVVPDGACMVEEVLRFAPFFAQGSCGQCGPCVQGTRKIADLVEDVRWGARDRRPLEMLQRLGQRLPGMGICGLITGATAASASALALFPEDFEHHARFGMCPGLAKAPGPLSARRRSSLSGTSAGSRTHFGGRHPSPWLSR